LAQEKMSREGKISSFYRLGCFLIFLVIFALENI